MDPVILLALIADLYSQLQGVIEQNKNLTKELDELKAKEGD